jgi:histidyl-tRNA synthetase
MEALKAVPGTHDLLPDVALFWDRLRHQVEDLMALHGYGRIETPHFEAVELFARGVGETTDIVQKEMYTFTDQGGRDLALRPEGTAGVVRAYLEARLDRQRPFSKLWYWGPMFRAERPQKGRYRQFWQFGVEAVGSPGPQIDAEQVILAVAIATGWGLTDLAVKINSVGDRHCRPAYRELLRGFLNAVSAKLCADCRRRIESNPLRVLDCKEERCREATRDAPLLIDHLCAPCAEHLAGLRELLDAAGVAYEMDGRIVRGLDYYERTAFEVTSSRLGAQSALLGGGRYDGLSEVLGGPPLPAVGWAAGIERFVLAAGDLPAGGPLLDAFIATFPETVRAGFGLALSLRRAGLRVDLDFLGRSIKAQLKEADRSRARFAIVMGPDEWARQAVMLRDLSRGTQEEVAVAALADRLKGA